MKSTQMIFRLAFLVALVVGLGGLFHLFAMNTTVRDVHIVSGLIMLVAIGWLAIETKSPIVIVSALLVVAGGIIPLVSPSDPLSIRIFHIAIMVVAVGLAEMGVGRTVRNKMA